MSRTLVNFFPMSDDDLTRLASEVAEEQKQRAENYARYEREGCKLVIGFIYDYCGTCGRDSIDMKDCPHAKSSEATADAPKDDEERNS